MGLVTQNIAKPVTRYVMPCFSAVDTKPPAVQTHREGSFFVISVARPQEERAWVELPGGVWESEGCSHLALLPRGRERERQ